MTEGVCVACETNERRTLPNPIPEGMVVMWSEGYCGYALYCQECFDASDTEGE